MSQLRSHELFELYQKGHSEAATEIFDRYVDRLLALARTRISPKLKRRIEAEDVVQSAFRSFFIHSREGAYNLPHAGDLWRLLAGIALNKLYRQVERSTAHKRNLDLEKADLVLSEIASTPEPSAAEVIALVEELSLVLKRLDTNERAALVYQLQGKKAVEISKLLNKSARTIRRLLGSARRKVEQQLLEPEDSQEPFSLAISVDLKASLNFADYTLEHLIAAGGMGKVYRASEMRSGNIVAIKTLHKSCQSDVQAISSFLQESAILATLNHPNIVKLQGIGQFPNGGFFAVMEYVEGADLQSRILQGPIAVQEVIAVTRQVLYALGFAHEHDIVHCDLKPGNVLLDKHGTAKVTDFGFAFLVSDHSRSACNGIGGTTGFIAPEILNSQYLPTPAADIYAIGKFISVLVTGKMSGNAAPFDHSALLSTRQTFAIVEKCIAEDPRDRYQSATQVLNDLEQIKV